MARDVLAEPGDERRGALGLALVDVPKADQAALLVRDLDAHGLLAGDGSEDPDVGRGQRVCQIVLERRDLRDLGPGGELELVAAHVRAGDHADHPRLDAEVLERLEERLRDRLALLRVRPGIALALLEHLRVRRPVIRLVGDRDPKLGALVPHGRQLDGLLGGGFVRLAEHGDGLGCGHGVLVAVRLVV